MNVIFRVSLQFFLVHFFGSLWSINRVVVGCTSVLLVLAHLLVVYGVVILLLLIRQVPLFQFFFSLPLLINHSFHKDNHVINPKRYQKRFWILFLIIFSLFKKRNFTSYHLKQYLFHTITNTTLCSFFFFLLKCAWHLSNTLSTSYTLYFFLLCTHLILYIFRARTST